jgi:ribulose kinase
MLNSGIITLPRSDRLFNQLVSLERHVARGGHDVIDHPRGMHDDLANAAMGAAVIAGTYGGYLEALTRACRDDDAPDEPTWADKERQRRYDELMRRYGQPVRGYLTPR